MFRFRMSVSTGLLALLGAVGVSVAGSNHPDAATVRAAFEHRASASVQSQPAAVRPSPLVVFNMRGTATSTFDKNAACPGVVCNASSGGCVCFAFTGNITGTPTGNGTWTANATVNIDDCTNTGTPSGPDPGFCCFGGGLLNIKTGSGQSASTLAMSFTGPVCSDPNADLQTSIQGGFIILTASSTGKYLHSAGTGELNAFVASDTPGTTYLSGNGTIQLVSPF
jgi:hypothetical protein